MENTASLAPELTEFTAAPGVHGVGAGVRAGQGTFSTDRRRKSLSNISLERHDPFRKNTGRTRDFLIL